MIVTPLHIDVNRLVQDCLTKEASPYERHEHLRTEQLVGAPTIDASLRGARIMFYLSEIRIPYLVLLDPPATTVLV